MCEKARRRQFFPADLGGKLRLKKDTYWRSFYGGSQPFNAVRNKREIGQNRSTARSRCVCIFLHIHEIPLERGNWRHRRH